MVNRSLSRSYMPRGYDPRPARKRDTRVFDKVAAIVLAVFAVLLLLLTIMDRLGLKLIYQETGLIGCIVLIAGLLGWGAYHLVARISNQSIRILMGLTLILLLLTLALYALTQLLEFGQYMLPHFWQDAVSPEGKQVVVLREWDKGMGDAEGEETILNATFARMDARKAAIEAAAAEAGEASGDGGADATGQEETNEYPRGSYGYIITVRPKVLGIFMDTKAALEGEVYLGLESEATLGFDWSAPGLHLTVTDPEPGDGGEAILALN